MTADRPVEPQAGKLDWHRENVGRITLADFNHVKGARQNQVFVATDSSVVAALNMRNGATGESSRRRALVAASHIHVMISSETHAKNPVSRRARSRRGEKHVTVT